MPRPDHFPAPDVSAVRGHRITTPPSMGGGVALSDRQMARASGLLADREPDTDTRAGAAMQRWWAERYARKIRILGSGAGAGASIAWAQAQGGGPGDGFTWNVRRLIVGPTDFSAAMATGVTTLAVIGTQQQPPAGALTSDQILSWTQAWPAQGTWGMGEATLEGGDYLWVGVVGLGSGVAFTFGGEARETAAGVPEIYGL